MSAKLLDFPHPEPLKEWKIEVNSREDDSVTCTYIPAGTRRTVKEAHWLLWVHATTIDLVPALVEEAKRLLKINRTVGARTPTRE